MTHPTCARRSAAVRVHDVDLDADVRAVLAALDVAVRDADAAEVLVTDDPAGAPVTAARVIVVAADAAGGDDDAAVIRLPSRTDRLVAALSSPAAAGGGVLLMVAGAVGGGGTSTLAVALAARASGGNALLVEADPGGAGLDLATGLEDAPGLRVDDIRSDLGAPDPTALAEAAPRTQEGLRVLARARGDGRVEGVQAARAACRAALAHRHAGGTVVCDAGPAPARDVLTAADLVVVTTRADLAGALRAADVLRSCEGAALLAVRTRPGDALEAADVAESCGVRDWVTVPETRGLPAAAGSGLLATRAARGTGRFDRLARTADRILEGAGDVR